VVVSPVPSPSGGERNVPPDMAVLMTGVAILAVGYAPSAFVPMQSDHKGDDYLYIPVIGPWLDLANRGCAGATIATADGPIELESQQPCGTSPVERAALIASGILQGVGGLQIMGAFFVQQKPTLASGAPPMPRFAIVPTVFGTHGMGAMARGRF